jgi:hypothetical protein
MITDKKDIAFGEFAQVFRTADLQSVYNHQAGVRNHSYDGIHQLPHQAKALQSFSQ